MHLDMTATSDPVPSAAAVQVVAAMAKFQMVNLPTGEFFVVADA
jgi:hypothetical protein